MTAGIWFWVLYVVSILLGGFGGWGVPEANRRYYWGGGIVVFVLIGLLGWGIFGAPLR